MQWGSQQASGLTEAARWLEQCQRELAAGMPLSRPVFRLFGFAGTGKTTLAKHLAAGAGGPVFYCAFTGKAALVMRKSGCHGAQTIHSMIYSAEQDEDTDNVSFVWDEKAACASAALIVVDECSMVDEALGADLLRYERPVLVLGDPAQLPPVLSDKDKAAGRGAGFFTEATPDVMLTEIHRQALENPIVRLASDVREGNPLRIGQYGESKVIAWRDITAAMVLAADQVLVGKNDTRSAYNTRIRELKGFSGHLPAVTDRLVCLKNDKIKGIFNGGMYLVNEVSKPKTGRAANGEIRLELADLDQDRDNIRVTCRVECFTGKLEALPWEARRGLQEFTYGYALTVHKAQGSQWDSVLLLDQSATFREDARRWLYTGITRAAETITIAI